VERLKNLARRGNLVIIPVFSRGFGFSTQRVPAILYRFQRANE
jgi:hypothetical protein